MKNLEELYKEWCKDTKRGGGVLIGSSIHEFFKFVEKKELRNTYRTSPIYGLLETDI